LKKNKVGEQSICVPKTAACWERLAVARGHSKQFQATNGMNITDNNIYIAFEMKYQVEARAAAKKDKKNVGSNSKRTRRKHSKPLARKERVPTRIWWRTWMCC
jgi:hypothetical protein